MCFSLATNKLVLWCAKSLSCVWLFGIPWTVAHQGPLSMGILQARILEWVAMPSSRQGIFPTRSLLHCRQILYHVSHHGNPRILEWVAYPFPRGSFRPRNWTEVSCIAVKFFTSRAIREAPQTNLHHLKKKKKLSFYPWTLSSHCSNHTYKPLTIHTHTHQIHSPSTHLLHPLNTYFCYVSAILLRLLSKSRKSSL